MFLYGILLVCLTVVSITQGFLPNKKRIIGANLAFGRLGSITHRAMTETAIEQIINVLLEENPATPNPNVIRRNYYLRRAMNEIQESNAKVDLEELTVAAAHFDAEQFEDGQKRLVEYVDIVSCSIRDTQDYSVARKYMGSMLHTLQDFYSHTNWIESGNTSPYKVLGDPDKAIENTAGPEIQTCTDCSLCDDPELTLKRASLGSFFAGVPIESTKCYECNNNIITDKLTSGYYKGGKDSEGKVIIKPEGKCSHGGIYDGSTDQSPLGGINKDSLHKELASHLSMHENAANVAAQASVDMLKTIRRNVANDVLFGAFLALNVRTGITVVVSNSGNMAEELPEIQTMITTLAPLIQESYSDVSIQYTLQTLDDSDEISSSSMITDDMNQFASAIAKLNASGFDDGSGPTIEAIIEAAQASEAGSSMFVFTDSSASDENLLGDAEAILLEKNIKVSFVRAVSSVNKRSFTAKKRARRHIKHHHKRQLEDGSYETLATMSGGETLEVQASDISNLVEWIVTSTIEYQRTMFHMSSITSAVTNYDKSFNFNVDSYATRLLIVANGPSININILTPAGINAASLVQFSLFVTSTTTYIASINITDNNLRGMWSLVLQSQGPYDVNIKQISGITIDIDLTIDNPVTNATISIDGKTLKGQQILGSLTTSSLTSDNNESLNISQVNLINNYGIGIQSIDFTMIDETNYLFNFTPPADLTIFQLQIIGNDNEGYTLSHICDMSVEDTTISLTLVDNAGFAVLTPRSGNRNEVLNLSLVNVGSAAQFRLVATVDNETKEIQYSVVPATIFLDANASANIKLQIIASSNVPVPHVATLTVVASSVADNNINDFAIVEVSTIENNYNVPDFAYGLSPSAPSILLFLVFLTQLLWNSTM